jgi:hypothetical protein
LENTFFDITFCTGSGRRTHALQIVKNLYGAVASPVVNDPIFRGVGVYYESMERKLLKPIYECRCNGRLQTQRFTRLYFFIVSVESIKGEPKIRGLYECRCDERLQTKTKEFTRLPYTGLVLELEHLKIETRLINERFANAMGECEN